MQTSDSQARMGASVLPAIDSDPAPHHGAARVQSRRTSRRFDKRILFAIVLFSISISSALLFVHRPWCDEAWFASCGFNLAYHGFMGMTILDPRGNIFAAFIKSINQYTYWVMPGYILFQAAWYKLLGFGLWSMRAISIFWSVIALCSWFFVVRQITKDRIIALLATFLLGVERNFTLSAATGRMDMMCAALGLAALALYLRFRPRLALAVFLAATAAAMAFFTHPNAIFGILSLVIVACWLDRRRFSVSTLVLATLPFVIFGALWLPYIAQAPDAFLPQMLAQAKVPYRFVIPIHPIDSLLREVTLRYGQAYGFLKPFPASLTAAVFVMYVISAIMAIAIPKLRRQEGVKILFVLACVHFGMLLCFQKNWYYLIFVVPGYTALLAVVLVWLWRNPRVPKLAVSACVITVTALHLSAVLVRVMTNDYENRFKKAADYLAAHASPSDLIIGSGELAFVLGFDSGRVIDDARLGYLSGKKPEYIVVEHWYGDFWFSWLQVYEPETHRYIADLLTNEFDIVYDQEGDGNSTSERPYQILKRRPPSLPR